MRTRATLAGLACGVASVLLAACSSGESAGEVERVSLGSLLGVAPAPGRDDAELNRQAEEAVAACMAGEGWTYTPFTNPSATPAVEFSDEDEVARIKREGIGVAYSLLLDGDPTDGGDASAAVVDPNVAYVESLSEDEKAAYDASLHGTAEEQAATMTTQSMFDPYTGAEIRITGSHSGCQAEAYDNVYDDVWQSPDEVAAMRGYWDEIQARFAADPRKIALDEDWAACMSDAGYDYSDPESFLAASVTQFSTRANAILGENHPQDPTEGWTQDEIDNFFANATEEEVVALYDAAQPELTADQREQLEETFAEEVTLGLAEHACSLGIRDEAAEVYADVEEHYVLEHSEEIQALAASLLDGA